MARKGDTPALRKNLAKRLYFAARNGMKFPPLTGRLLESRFIPQPIQRPAAICFLPAPSNQRGFQRFGWHEVPKEFLLIGPVDAEPLYLAIFRGLLDALESKLESGSLLAEDFTCLVCRFNDPQTSFFTMKSGVPHGECVARETHRPPSFYVTEPAGTTILLPNWRDCSLNLVF